MSAFSRFVQHCFDVWNTSDVALFISAMVAVTFSALVIIAFDLWQGHREAKRDARHAANEAWLALLDEREAHQSALIQQQRDADAEWARIMTATRHN